MKVTIGTGTESLDLTSHEVQTWWDPKISTKPLEVIFGHMVRMDNCALVGARGRARVYRLFCEVVMLADREPRFADAHQSPNFTDLYMMWIPTLGFPSIYATYQFLHPTYIKFTQLRELQFSLRTATPGKPQLGQVFRENSNYNVGELIL